MKVFVSQDAASMAVGADALARGFAAAGAEVVRTGSRGMFWLEPMAEVETPEGRIAYGPLAPSDVAEVLAGRAEALRIGRIEEHPWFAGQTRLTFARCGLIDPTSLEDFLVHGGLAGLK